MSVLPDPETAFGSRVRTRLREETVIWLVTVNSAGVPQPNPVWFLFDPDAETMLIYNDRNAKRLASIDAHPNVAAHFDGDSGGGDIVVFTGVLEQDPAAPPVNENDGYLEKYDGEITRIGMDPDSFKDTYSVALTFRISKVRGH